MLPIIHNRLEMKIIVALTVVIACSVGVYTYYDIRNMRSDTIRTSERTLGAFAAAIKGSVNTSMKSGHHEDVKRILEEVNTPYFIDRVMIYSEEGRPLRGMEKMRIDRGLEMTLPPAILASITKGDQTEVVNVDGHHYISYFSPISNQPECFRCHGDKARLNGILRIDFTLNDLDDLIALRRNRDLLWSSVLVILILAVLVAVLRIVVHRPVRQLRNAMAQIQAGADTVILTTDGDDELADLKKGFLDMLRQINTLHKSSLENETMLARNQEMVRFRLELQGMFDAMPDGVLLLDPELRIVQSNPRAYKLLPGLRALDGRIPAVQVEEESNPHHGVLSAFRDAAISEHQCEIRLADGTIRYVHSICAPVIEDGRTASVVEVIRDITDRVRTERELEEKTEALSAANKALSRLASTDKLTQLYNRYSFDEIFSQEIKRCSRQKTAELAVMMIDIDHFKDLNDQYGHLTGDAVLREVAALLKEEMRDTDTVARYGGEEFVVITPYTDLQGAVFKAEVLRKKMEERKFAGLDEGAQVTISIGVAAYVPDVLSTPHALIHAADQALYTAKKTGRNKVVMSRDGEGLT